MSSAQNQASPARACAALVLSVTPPIEPPEPSNSLSTGDRWALLAILLAVAQGSLNTGLSLSVLVLALGLATQRDDARWFSLALLTALATGEPLLRRQACPRAHAAGRPSDAAAVHALGRNLGVRLHHAGSSIG